MIDYSNEPEDKSLDIQDPSLKELYDNYRSYIDANVGSYVDRRELKQRLDIILKSMYAAGRQDERYHTQGPSAKKLY